MSSIPASVYLICCNEAANIRRALDSVRDFAEIVVVDSGSTDATVAIAREYTDRVLHQDWLGYAAQKQVALEHCTLPWALNIDADEVASAALLEEIRQVIAADDVAALSVPIRDHFMHRPPHPWVRANRKPRFFRRDAVRYKTTLAHEGVIVDGPVAKAQGAIDHFGETSLAVKVEKNNRYSSLKAEEKFAAGKRASLLKLLLIFPFAFFRSYVLKRNLLNGRMGFITSTVNAYYAFLKEAKLLELQWRQAEKTGKKSR